LTALLQFFCYISGMNKLLLPALLILYVSTTNAGYSTEIMEQTRGDVNHLATEKSPYLLQHKDNPVWWYPWGDAAFDKAAAEHKVIFLSVGYSTCHWCHVMERESFEDQEVADFMNRHFVAIKVDREQRPDVDAIYMTALQQLNNGLGGWPMTLFLTPDRKPFYGTTYVPKARLMGVMSRIQALWANDSQQLSSGAEEITDDLQAFLSTPAPGETKGQISLSGSASLARYLTESERRWDKVHGGFQTLPRFPMAMDLLLHMRLAARSARREDARAIETWVRLTLEAMARGGLFDHVGGGFHRYATDNEWLVPHFEKMLYDNALLSQVYLEAYQRFKSDEFARVARETCDYILRDLQHVTGGFYTAEDADSTVTGNTEKSEGAYYVFSASELRQALRPEEMKHLEQIFEIKDSGNFKGKNILRYQSGVTGGEPYTWDLRPVMNKIFTLREKRPRPPRDEKMLVSWNGLMIASLAAAAGVLQQEEYYRAAARATRFIWNNLYSGNSGLKHHWISGSAGGAGYAEDYAAFIHGLLALYQADFNPDWLDKAVILQKEMDARFWSMEVKAYYRDDGTDASLLVRAVDSRDDVTPSASSLALMNLLQLRDLTYEQAFGDRARQLVAGFSSRLKVIPQTLPYFLIGLDYMEGGGKQLAVVGKTGAEDTQTMMAYLREHYLPAKVVAFGDPDNKRNFHRVPLLQGKIARQQKTTAYVCEANICLEPTSDVKKMGALLARRKPMSPVLMP